MAQNLARIDEPAPTFESEPRDARARAQARYAALEPFLAEPRSPIAEDLLLRYCIASVEADDAQAAIDHAGLMVKMGKSLVVNPCIAIRDSATATMTKLAERLDLNLSRLDQPTEERGGAVVVGNERAVATGGRPERFKVSEVRKALEKAGGSQTGAAQLLKCSRRTIARYIKAHPSLRDALGEIDAIELDEAETNLRRGVRRGEGWAVIFTLRTKGRHLGYTTEKEDPRAVAAAAAAESGAVVIELPDNGRGDRPGA